MDPNAAREERELWREKKKKVAERERIEEEWALKKVREEEEEEENATQSHTLPLSSKLLKIQFSCK